MAAELTNVAIAKRLAELESEIRHLRIQLRGRAKKPVGEKFFSDLCGIWKGQHDFTYEEIAEVRYRTPENLL
jgi:hypothetical protein